MHQCANLDIIDWILKVDDDCYVDVRVLLHYTRSLRPKTSHNHLIGKVKNLGRNSA